MRSGLTEVKGRLGIEPADRCLAIAEGPVFRDQCGLKFVGFDVEPLGRSRENFIREQQQHEACNNEGTPHGAPEAVWTALRSL